MDENTYRQLLANVASDAQEAYREAFRDPAAYQTANDPWLHVAVVLDAHGYLHTPKAHTLCDCPLYPVQHVTTDTCRHPVQKDAWGIWKGGNQVALMRDEQAARNHAASPIHGSTVVHVDHDHGGWVDDKGERIVARR